MTMEGHVDHPYVPRDLKLSGYVPCFLSQSDILVVYGASSVLVVSLVWLLSGRIRKISKVDRILMCRWIFTALTSFKILLLVQHFVFVNKDLQIAVEKLKFCFGANKTKADTIE